MVWVTVFFFYFLFFGHGLGHGLFFLVMVWVTVIFFIFLFFCSWFGSRSFFFFGGHGLFFCLVRGTIFSQIQYIYIFIPNIFMTHPSYWLRCENLICGPRFDSGTSLVIVVGPRSRPCSSLNSLRKCPPPPPRILNFGQQSVGHTRGVP